MRGLVVLAAFALLAPNLGAHSNGTCPARKVEILVGDGVHPWTIYHVDYSLNNEWVPTDWLYAENGVRPNVQTGNNHVLLGSTWGHDHSCYWPVAEERDLEIY